MIIRAKDLYKPHKPDADWQFTTNTCNRWTFPTNPAFIPANSLVKATAADCYLRSEYINVLFLRYCSHLSILLTFEWNNVIELPFGRIQDVCGNRFIYSRVVRFIPTPCSRYYRRPSTRNTRPHHLMFSYWRKGAGEMLSFYSWLAASLRRAENPPTHNEVNAALGLHIDATGAYAGSAIAVRQISGYPD